jgi:hypothetical protein
LARRITPRKSSASKSAFEAEGSSNRSRVRDLDICFPADQHLLVRRRLRPLWQGSLPLHMQARTQEGTAKKAGSRKALGRVPHYGGDVDFVMTMRTSHTFSRCRRPPSGCTYFLASNRPWREIRGVHGQNYNRLNAARNHARRLATGRHRTTPNAPSAKWKMLKTLMNRG